MLDLLDLLGLRLEPFCIQLSSCKVIVALGRTPTAPAANVADARLGQHIRPVWHPARKLEECEFSERPERRSYDTTEHEYRAVRIRISRTSAIRQVWLLMCYLGPLRGDFAGR
jgi:hypothetical protein